MPTALSLFSGAGGLDLGVERAGFQILFAVENDPVAVQTLNANRAKFFCSLPLVERLDITCLNPRDVLHELHLEPGAIDLLVGGPPCVAFSKSGFHLEYKRQGKDSRADLLNDYLKFLDVVKPKAFVMENVYGLAYRNQSSGPFRRLLGGIRAVGYSVHAEVLNAADYGVPQNRQRLFVIGASDGRRLSLPPATHWGEHERRVRRAQDAKLRPHLTAGDALAGLNAHPEPEEDVNGKYGHLLPDIPPGRNYLYYTAHEGYPCPLFEWRSRYWTFLLKLDPLRPASTIQAQPGPYVGPFHWDNRRLRVPELKRLQTFPDKYYLLGTRREVQVQVGNSVPPDLAFVIADYIRQQLQGQFRSAQSILHQLELPVATALVRM
jgi:DNA (cytosine-5)-methyltransferase 1